jgi:hypothetical protein
LPASLCGAELPADLSRRLSEVQDDNDAKFEIGVELAVEQSFDLLNHGAQGIHFNVLNRSTAYERIVGAMGLSLLVAIWQRSGREESRAVSPVMVAEPPLSNLQDRACHTNDVHPRSERSV